MEAIGAAEKDSKKSTEPYQDAVTSVPGDADLDAAAAAVDDLANDDPELAGCSGIKASVSKLGYIYPHFNHVVAAQNCTLGSFQSTAAPTLVSNHHAHW